MRGILVVAIHSILTLGVLAPMTAAAQEPPASVDSEFDLAGVCPFTVHFEVIGKAKTIADLPGNRTIFTSPGLHVTLTNASNPEKHATFNVTGSFHQTILENGDVVTEANGRNILFQFESAGFESFLELTIGTFSYTFDAQGNLKQSATGDGQRIDLCELLQ